MRKLLFLISLFFIQNIFCQVTFVIDNLPENTPKNAAIYISGDFEGWTGGQDAYKLSENNEVYSITLPKALVDIQFKFTQGSWETVETSLDGNDIENRTHTFDKEKQVVKIHIENWDKPTDRISTATENVSVLSEDFYIPQLDRKRKIWLYLPPDYNTSTKKYPVIYMHDGQNLFDSATSGFGEWEVDETLDALFEETGFGAIVIGVENGGTLRLDEYSPWVNKKYGGGEGDAYLEFLVETLKPYVDANYRTKSNKENTAIIGSSMGGLIAYYTAIKHPNVFGNIGVYSPAFWFAPEINEFAKSIVNIHSTKLYFLAGSKEGLNNTVFPEISQTVKDMNLIIDILIENGCPTKNIKSKVISGGKHNEKLWRENFEEAIRWLFNE